MKNIVILSDGTGNAAAKVWRTNVWRVFEAIDLSQPDQIAHYDDGVGTSSFKPLALFGGMFGYGLKHNVIDCYKFVCRSYKSEDRIYGFGFSRGAYTIRVVAKLIISQGLVTYDYNEADLHRYAIAAYRAFRKQYCSTVWRIEVPLRYLRDLVLRTHYDYPKSEVSEIHFLGLWDTVAAYGLPFAELTRFYSNWIFPFELLDTCLSSKVDRACHALSIDDERTTFTPQLWTENNLASSENNAASVEYTHQETISQVWFAGVHSNVGGGYPDDALAQVSLSWILEEAKRRNLRFKETPGAEPDALLSAKSAADKDGRLYDPRKGLGSYYRYGPRNIAELCNQIDIKNPDNSMEISLPKIHHTVFERIRNGAYPYAPIGLPEKYAVVAEGGKILKVDKDREETDQQATLRFRHQDSIWDHVWKRRIAYFGILLSSAFLVLFPLLHRVPASAEYTSRLRPVSDLIRLIGAFIPFSLTSFWIDGYAREPILFLIGVVSLVALFHLNYRMGRKISDSMRAIWKASLANELQSPPKHTWAYHTRTNQLYIGVRTVLQLTIVPAASALVVTYLFLTISSHLLFNFFDAAGFVCKESDPRSLHTLTSGEPTQTVSFRTDALCQSTGIFLQQYNSYVIQFDSTKSFRDGSIDGSRGYSFLDLPQRRERFLKLVLTPLRREWFRPWFSVVARIGGVGSEETFLDPDFRDTHWIDERISATRSGELFLFVNDAVIPLPYLFGYFYANNVGTATVTISLK